jgi:hypothetical protein
MNKEKDSMIENKNNIDNNIWHLYSHVDVQMDNNEQNDNHNYYADINNNSNGKGGNVIESVVTDINGNIFTNSTTIDSNMGVVFKDRFKKFLKKSKNRRDPPKYPKIMFQCRAARRPGYFYWVKKRIILKKKKKKTLFTKIALITL